MKANEQEINAFKLSFTNCYLIKCPEGYLLIDTSYAKQYNKFVEGLEKRNIGVSEIKYLLLTHHHDDHAGFAAKLKEQSGCKIIVHKNAIASLKNGKNRTSGRMLNTRVYLTYSLFRRFYTNFRYPPVTVDKNDILISGDDDDTLRQIGINGKIIYTPGHSDDSISVIMDDGRAFVGDAAMNFSKIFSFCGIHHRPIFIEDLGRVFDSWQKIIDTGAETIYPSHGKPFSIDRLIYYRKKFTGSR